MSLLCTTAFAAPEGSIGAVINTALDQMGYVEGADEYSKFGEWYGYPHGYWCDMFVSWCASAAGVSKDVVSRDALCQSHLNWFKKRGLYHKSKVFGGDYIPKQGDLIFFYNPVDYPDASRAGHIGYVLYVENNLVFTIEGNTLANRLDCVDRFLRDPNVKNRGLPRSRVVVNCFPLNNPRTLGYASPDYKDRTQAELDGFVDLGRFSDRESVFSSLDSSGIMPATSSHTFSPHHGMSRGNFTAALMRVFGLENTGSPRTVSDVTPENPNYSAIMSALSTGVAYVDDNGKFYPNRYISGPEAQGMISRLLAYLGLENKTFTFSQGDFPAYGDYTIRADLASALYSLQQSYPQDLVVPKPFSGSILLNGVPMLWDAMDVGGVCYVPLEALQTAYPELSAPGWSATGRPSYATYTTAVIDCGGQKTNVPGFSLNGRLYVSLSGAVLLTGRQPQFDGGAYNLT